MNYKNLFTNNVLYITGVGRSGTTILGQIIASMRPVYYLFELSILRPPLNNDHEILRRNLFEDYFLNEILGRCNPSMMDWTYWGKYMTLPELQRRQSLYGRSDAIKLIEDEKPLFVIKNPEAQHMLSDLADIFPGIRFIHILRNGLDVIGSSLARGWFVDDYEPIDDYDEDGFSWMNNFSMLNKNDVYWHWQKWNPITRTACTWRILTEMGMEYCKNNIGTTWEFKYEDFCKYLNTGFVNVAVWKYDIKSTDLTNKHLQSVKDFNPQKYDIKINDIQQPERSKFVELMEKMGYL